MNSFQKTDKERIEIQIYKAINKRERRKEFGISYKKHLNISEKKIEPFKIIT